MGQDGRRPETDSETFVEVCRRRDLKLVANKSKVMVLGGGRDWNVRSVGMGCDCSKCQSSNIWYMIWMNQEHMLTSFQVLLGP